MLLMQFLSINRVREKEFNDMAQEVIKIRGGQTLKGRVEINGAKIAQ